MSPVAGTTPSLASLEPENELDNYVLLHDLEAETRQLTLDSGIPDLEETLARAHRARAAARVHSAGKPAFRPDVRLSDAFVERDLADCEAEIGERRAAIEQAEDDLAHAEEAVDRLGMGTPWLTWARLGLAAFLIGAVGTLALGLLLVESVDAFVLRSYWQGLRLDPASALGESRYHAKLLAFAIAGCFVGLPAIAAFIAGKLSTRAKVVILTLELIFAAAFAALRMRSGMTSQAWSWSGFELAVAGTALVLAFHVSHCVGSHADASSAARAATNAAKRARFRLDEERDALDAALQRREASRHQVRVRDWDQDLRGRIAANAQASVALMYELTTREISARVPNPYEGSARRSS